MGNPTEAAIGDGLGHGTIVVANKGPGLASGVKLVDTLPRGVSFDSATPSRGSCDREKRVITCSLGSLAGGTDATVAIVVTPTGAGTITNQASVTGDQPEQEMANNKGTQATTVTGRR